MIYLRRLFESRSFTERVPAQGLIGGAPGEWATLQKAMAGIAKDSTWAIVYFPNDTCKRNIKTGIISGDRMNAWWYNPRDGKCYTLENVETNLPFAEYVSNEIQIYEFDPPGNGGPPYDWVLILDNANEGYVQP
jgi:hypothetical protein